MGRGASGGGPPALDPLVEAALAGALAVAGVGGVGDRGGEVGARARALLGRRPPAVALGALDSLRAQGWPRGLAGDAARAALVLSQALGAAARGPVVGMDARRRMVKSREAALRRKAEREARLMEARLRSGGQEGAAPENGGQQTEPGGERGTGGAPGGRGVEDEEEFSALEEGQGLEEELSGDGGQEKESDRDGTFQKVSSPGTTAVRGPEVRLGSQGRGSQGRGSQGLCAADVGGPEECPGVFNEGCSGRLQRRWNGPRGWFFCSQCQYVWVQEVVPGDLTSLTLELHEDPAYFAVGRTAPGGSSASSGVKDAHLLHAVESYLEGKGFSRTLAPGGALIYPVDDYKGVVAALKEWRALGNVALGEIPANTLWNLHQLKNRAVPSDAVELIFQKIPEKLRRSLMPYQVEGVKFGISRNGRILFGDEMGLGKSIQAIALSCCYQSEGPLLVVCPASLRLVWAEEMERWIPGLRPKDIHVIFNSGTALPESSGGSSGVPRVTITSYHMLANLRKRMEKVKWGFVVADESHCIRATDLNPATGTSSTVASAVAVLKKAKRMALLSGTPSLNKPFDLFLQVDALCPCLLGDMKRFATVYCNMERRRGSFFSMMSAGKRLKELHILLQNTVMVRRMKDTVLEQLPPKRRQVIRLAVDRTDKGRRGSAGRRQNVPGDEGAEEGEEGGGGGLESGVRRAMNQDQGMKSHHRVGMLKVKEVCSLINLVLQQRQKTLVFGHHHDVMDKIQVEVGHSLESRTDNTFVRIDGRTGPEERQAFANKFQSDPQCRLALLSIRAAGVGMNFSAAKCVIFAELPRTVSDLEQAEARAHRHGVKSSVNVYFAVARDPSDEATWRGLGVATDRLCAVHDGRETDNGVVFQDYVEARPMSQFRQGDFLLPTQLNTQAGSGRPPTKAREACGPGAGRGAELPPCEARNQFWFELSPHTGRVHAYTGPAGASEDHCQASCLSEALLAVEPQDIGCSVAAAATGDLAGLPGVFSSGQCFREAVTFLREWLALRPLDQRKLQGRPLQGPLAEELAALPQGETRLTTNRFVSVEELRVAQLPPGAAFHRGTLKVRWGRRQVKEFPVEQPRLSSGTWLCTLCMEALPAYMQGGAHLEVTNKAALFCSKPCYDKYAACSSSSIARRELFSLEKGVCQECGLDCEDLCRRLQAYHRKTVDSGNQSEVLEKRSAVLKARAPAFFERGFAAVRARLLQSPAAGHAWQADHILPVFRGGGMLGLENLRTLCTTCHLKVTKKQATWRKNQRGALRLLSPSKRQEGKAAKRPRSRWIEKTPKREKFLSTQEEDERRASILVPPSLPSSLSSLSSG